MKFLKRFSTQDLLYIAIFSALGLAIKPLITPIAQMLSRMLMITGGSLFGGLYMMWIVLAVATVRKPWAGTLVGLVQGFVMLALGYIGTHGALSILTFTLPGIAADIAAFFPHNFSKPISHIVVCVSANLAGTLLVSILVWQLPFIPILISLGLSLLSAIGGGLLSFLIFKRLQFFGLTDK
ncbi:MAG: ECF transporter S component [Candidatus Cloacimonetes bacterium]|nr:ECF transporter S component [Candidatus Cloacimonadota bacterium]